MGEGREKRKVGGGGRSPVMGGKKNHRGERDAPPTIYLFVSSKGMEDGRKGKKRKEKK